MQKPRLGFGQIFNMNLGFLGILKMGGIVQPLFSAFGPESLFVRLQNAGTSAILTQKKHLPKVRKIRDSLPALRHIIVVDPVNGKLYEFWQGRKTDQGWQASNAATFNLKTGALRPEMLPNSVSQAIDSRLMIPNGSSTSRATRSSAR